MTFPLPPLEFCVEFTLTFLSFSFAAATSLLEDREAEHT